MKNLEDLKELVSGAPGSLTAPAPYVLNDDSFKISDNLMQDPIRFYFFLCKKQQELLDYIMICTKQGCGIPNEKSVMAKMSHIAFLIKDSHESIRIKIYEKLGTLSEVEDDYLTHDYWGVPTSPEPMDIPRMKSSLLDILSIGHDKSLLDESRLPVGVIPVKQFLSEYDTHTHDDIPENHLVDRAGCLCQALLRYIEQGRNLPASENTDHTEEVWVDELIDISLAMSLKRANAYEKAVNKIGNIKGLLPDLFSEQEIEHLEGILND